MSVPAADEKLREAAPFVTEHELRFRLDQAEADSFADLPMLEAAGPPKLAELRNTYFDTPDFALSRAGCSLRIRDGATMLRQTLKVPAGSGMAHDLRVEMERDVASSRPSLTPLERRKLPGRRLRQRFDEARLQPAYLTQYRRLSWNVTYRGSVIEVSLDRGEITAGNQAQPICEVELELKRGVPTDMLVFAMALCEAAPLAPCMESKSARAARLSGARPDKPRTIRKLRLKGLALTEVFAALVHECLVQQAANLVAFERGQPPEAVHQMRIALRRLSAVVWAFKPLVAAETRAGLADLLRQMRQRLAPARAA